MKTAVALPVLYLALDTGSAQQQGLWSLLNSSFVLWVLSSVVLGGLTALVAWYQKRHGEHTRKSETQRRLNIEISSRVLNGAEALDLDQKRIEKGQVYFASIAYSAAGRYLDNRLTDKDGKAEDWSIYPEYRGRKFLSLIF